MSNQLIEELLDKLKKENIILNKAILNVQYANSYHIKQLSQLTKTQYQKHITKKNEKWIDELLEKIVSEHYDIHDIPDPYYIYKELKELDGTDFLALKHNVERMRRMTNLTHLNSIAAYFDDIDTNIKDTLLTVLNHYSSSQQNEDHQQIFIDTLNTLITIFNQDLDLSEDIDLLALKELSRFANKDKIDAQLIKIKQTYYVSVYKIYAHILMGMQERPDLKKEYYHRAMQYMVLTPEDQEWQNSVEQLYENKKTA